MPLLGALADEEAAMERVVVINRFAAADLYYVPEDQLGSGQADRDRQLGAVVADRVHLGADRAELEQLVWRRDEH
jgi:hypothetical protein